MPVIINGEVVADTDPRAVAHRNRGRNSQQQQQRRGTGRFGTLGGSSSNNNTNNNGRFASGRNNNNNNNNARNGQNGPLAGLENLLGVSGKTFKVPAVLGNPSFEVPVIILIIVAFVTLLTSWRFGLGATLLVYLYYNSLQTPAAPPR